MKDSSRDTCWEGLQHQYRTVRKRSKFLPKICRTGVFLENFTSRRRSANPSHAGTGCSLGGSHYIPPVETGEAYIKP